MSAHKPITVLSDDSIKKIAAGEVVERPASIVKELMENAIDADATQIDVSILDGGLSSIEITDNGSGIAGDDLLMAVEKHATSKIDSASDLAQLRSFGFRGEALASISAVSQFELSSKSVHESIGHRIWTDQGTIHGPKPDAYPEGTKLSIKDLFWSTPVRRKFLRSRSTEFGHVEKTFRKIALAHPQIGFSLDHQSKRVFDLKPVEGFFQRIASIYPRQVSESLIRIHEHEDDRLMGWVSKSGASMDRPSELWFFVNGRWIQDRLLQRAVLEGYRSIQMQKRYPIGFIYMKMDPALFDVNVHPNKAEIRFSSPQAIFSWVSQGVRKALMGGVSTPNTATSHAPYRYVHPTNQPSSNPKEGVQSSRPKEAYTDLKRFRAMTRQRQEHALRTYAEGSKIHPSQVRDAVRTPQNAMPTNKPLSSNDSVQTDILNTQTELGQLSLVQETDAFFSSCEILGQLEHTFWVLKKDETLMLLDQHAADERVRYHRLKESHAQKNIPIQMLLVPHQHRFMKSQKEAYVNLVDYLTGFGFDMEVVDDESIVVRAIPEWFERAAMDTALADMISDFQQFESESISDGHVDDRLASMACHSAVRAKDRLNPVEIRALLKAMDEVELASYCPHGRPTYVILEHASLEKLFKRT